MQKNCKRQPLFIYYYFISLLMQEERRLKHSASPIDTWKIRKQEPVGSTYDYTWLLGNPMHKSVSTSDMFMFSKADDDDALFLLSRLLDFIHKGFSSNWNNNKFIFLNFMGKKKLNNPREKNKIFMRCSFWWTVYFSVYQFKIYP